jgi:hypothetical protein
MYRQSRHPHGHVKRASWRAATQRAPCPVCLEWTPQHEPGQTKTQMSRSTHEQQPHEEGRKREELCEIPPQFFPRQFVQTKGTRGDSSQKCTSLGLKRLGLDPKTQAIHNQSK